jgi:fructosamine-3-kinase
LHGDLWSGNFITGNDGEACIIDPAVYYGHREAELAFTQLFGGYDHRFYAAYHEAFPLHPGFEQRKDIYNLYPLLVHVNLFGGSYTGSVEGILKHV